MALGVLLMGARVVVGIVTIARMLADRNSLATAVTANVVGSEAAVALLIVNLVVIVSAASFAAYLVLAVFVYQRRNWARIAAMAFSVVSIILYAITFFNGERVTLLGDVFGLPVDILVLLALSAQSSSLWSRRRGAQRKQ